MIPHPALVALRRGDAQGALALLDGETGAGDDPLRLALRAQALERLGRAEEAIACLTRALARRPVAGLWNELGRMQVAAGAIASAETAFRRALEGAGAPVAALTNLANLLTGQGREEEALALYERARALDPARADTLFNMAHLLRRRGDVAGAIGLYTSCLAGQQGHYRARFNRGQCHEETGDFAQAAKDYRAVLALRPDHGRAMARLLALRDEPDDAALLARAREWAAAPGRGDRDHALIHNALGRRLDGMARYDEAFAHFATAGAARARLGVPFDALACRAQASRILARFAAPPATPLMPDEPLAIFVLGMPRAGTTLVEQILSCHPALFGAGEMPVIPAIWEQIADHAALPGEVERQRLRQIVLAEVARRHGGPMPQGFVDKLPFNFRHIGLIRWLFPAARILHCTRDARDVALSCLIEAFRPGAGDFSNRLPDIAAYMAIKNHMMAHWRAHYPVQDIAYEALVADPRGEIARLLAHCGLEWDEACMAFHTNPRAVQTPSRWQVRQPLYASSVGRWRHYAAHLATFAPAMPGE